MPTILKLRNINKDKKEKNNQSKQYYNTRKWQKIRAIQLRKQPLCEVCLSKGIITAADQVHHKIPFLTGNTDEEKKILFTDETNLQSICKQCHIDLHKDIHK